MRTLLLVLLMLLAAVPATATNKVRGKIRDAAGFTVTGTSAAGEGVGARLGADGGFTLAFPGTSARGATLQLIGPDGHYFGPIVLRHRAGSAWIALSGKSVNLKTIALHEGYAEPLRPAPKKAIQRQQVARADADGRPAGAARLGLVAAPDALVTGREESPAAPGEDQDADGIVDAFDADDDGDLVVDNADPDDRGGSGGVFSTLFVEDLTQSLNVNVGAVTQMAIDAVIQNHQNLVFFFDDAQFGEPVVSANVDCFTLPYCAAGTGTAELSGLSESSPDLPRGRPWIEYDPDGDGLPNLEPITAGFGAVHAAGIRPLATTADIAPGDAFDVVVTTATRTIRLPRSLPPYFVTTPAVVGYDAGAGPQTITYPVETGAPGTGGNPIALTGESLRLTFFRPQRLGIPGAEGDPWIDMGHLHYGIPLVADGREVACAGDYSDLSLTLVAAAAGDDDFANQLFPLTDTAADAAPGGDQTLSFTIDLGSCLRRAGVEPAGQTLMLGLTATGESRPGGVDRAAQFLTVRLPG